MAHEAWTLGSIKDGIDDVLGVNRASSDSDHVFDSSYVPEISSHLARRLGLCSFGRV